MILGTPPKLNRHYRDCCGSGDPWNSDEPFAEISDSLEAFFVGLHRLFIEFDSLRIDSLDQPNGGMDSFVSHSLRHPHRLGHAGQRITIPIIFQHSENPLDRIVFAVIGRMEVPNL